MNFGECPYQDCDGLLMLEVPERTPAYAEVQCDECGKDVWYRFSRVDPQAWTKEDFEREHIIDREGMSIVRRDHLETEDEIMAEQLDMEQKMEIEREDARRRWNNPTDEMLKDGGLK